MSQKSQNSPEEQVAYFNEVVLGIEPRPIGMMDQDEFDLSMTQLMEEIGEIHDAREANDMIGLVDGLIDLQYYLLGIFYKHGITPDLHNQLFSAVHSCNMLKVQGENEKRQGFNCAADAIKPEGWIDPAQLLARILEANSGKSNRT